MFFLGLYQNFRGGRSRRRWILSQKHQAAQSEYAITALLNGELQNYVIDRTFIDSVTSIRGVIDYKTTDNQGNKPEEFLNLAMRQYQQQLNNYAHTLLLDTQQTVRFGLYFPFTSLGCEWEFIQTSMTESIEHFKVGGIRGKEVNSV